MRRCAVVPMLFAAALVVAPALVAPASAQEAVNKAVWIRSIDEIWNAKDLSVIDELYADDLVMVQESGMGAVAGTAGYRQYVQAFLTGVPDIHMEVEEVLAEGDWAAIRFVGGGTQTGELMGIPATGRVARVVGISIARFRDGQFVENTSHLDKMALLQKLGVMPPPEFSEEGWGIPATSAGAGDPETSKRVAARNVDEVWNEGRPELIDELFADDFVWHSNDGPPMDREAWRQFVGVYMNAFPDVHFTTKTVIAEGDLVLHDWRVTGTQTGELMGIPATGRAIDIGGASIYRVHDGRMVEGWSLYDRVGMNQQLGLMPGGETVIEVSSWGILKRHFGLGR